MIVCSDHSQSQVEEEIDLFRGVRRLRRAAGARRCGRARWTSEIAVCPASRSAQVYVLDPERRAELVPRVERTLLALEGVDLVMRMTDHPDGEAVIRGRRGGETKELRFAPRGDLADLRGERWSVEGDLDLLALLGARGPRSTPPSTRTRSGATWSALRCPTSGELLASAAPGLRVPRLGRRAPRRRRLARRAARQRLARLADLVRHRARRPTRASSGRCATSSR